MIYQEANKSLHTLQLERGMGESAKFRTVQTEKEKEGNKAACSPLSNPWHILNFSRVYSVLVNGAKFRLSEA